MAEAPWPTSESSVGHTVEREIAALTRALDRASEAGEWAIVRDIRADLAKLREERTAGAVVDRLVAKVTNKG